MDSFTNLYADFAGQFGVLDEEIRKTTFFIIDEVPCTIQHRRRPDPCSFYRIVRIGQIVLEVQSVFTVTIKERFRVPTFQQLGAINRLAVIQVTQLYGPVDESHIAVNDATTVELIG
ncbi:hypothetical protein D3C86_1970170 [compost metagenome]